MIKNIQEELQLLRQQNEVYKTQVGKLLEIKQLSETLCVAVIPMLEGKFHFKTKKRAKYLLEKIQNL